MILKLFEVTCTATSATLCKPVQNYNGLRNERREMQAWIEEASASTITDQPLHLEKGGHDLGINPRFEWNDPPRPLAVPDTTSPHMAYSLYIFWGEFFRNL